MPIVHKRSDVSGKVPTTSQIALGELAVNTNDGKIYLKRDNGTEQIVGLLNDKEDLATLSDFFSGASGKVLTADVVRDARDYVTLTAAASVAIDLDTGVNFHLTTTGTHEIAVPTNGSGGVSGLIVIDLGGAHAVTFATGWQVPSTVDLTGTAGTQHALSYARMPGGAYRVSQFNEVV